MLVGLESGHAELRHAVGCLCGQPLCLLEAAEHGQEAIAARQYARRSTSGCSSSQLRHSSTGVAPRN